MSKRKDGRRPGDLRPVSIETGWMRHAEGSALVRVGHTVVVCTASVEDRVPVFLKGAGKGWITAEYGMLPRATNTRSRRESERGSASGRSHEIQRLIGRSLRAVADLTRLGERTIWVDCDVLQADGGTRTAAINGGFVALALACRKLLDNGQIRKMPLVDFVTAVSVGTVGGRHLLDLAYEEDSATDVDMNVVRTGKGRFIEIQGTAERRSFALEDLNAMLRLAGKGTAKILALQKKALAGVFP